MNAMIKKQLGTTANKSVGSGIPATVTEDGIIIPSTVIISYTKLAYDVTTPAASDIHAASRVLDHSMIAQNAETPPSTSLIIDSTISPCAIVFPNNRFAITRTEYFSTS